MSVHELCARICVAGMACILCDMVDMMMTMVVAVWCGAVLEGGGLCSALCVYIMY